MGSRGLSPPQLLLVQHQFGFFPIHKYVPVKYDGCGWFLRCFVSLFLWFALSWGGLGFFASGWSVARWRGGCCTVAAVVIVVHDEGMKVVVLSIGFLKTDQR